MTAFKLTSEEQKTVNNAMIFLSRMALSGSFAMNVALNLIEMEDKVAKIDKQVMAVAKKLGMEKDGRLVFTNPDDSQKLNDEAAIFLKDQKVVTCNLEVLSKKDFSDDIKIPGELLKSLLKLKLIK